MRQFAPRIGLETFLERPSALEAAHCGEVLLLEDNIAVMHRDGTVTNLSHTISQLYGVKNLSAWDQLTYVFDPSYWKPTILKAVSFPAELPAKKALETHAAYQSAPGIVVPNLRVIQIQFSHLRPQTLVEYEIQQDFFRPEEALPALWRNFYLRTSAPCRRRRITIAVAKPFAARIALHNEAAAPRSFEMEDYTVHQWDLSNQPGQEEDDWLPPPLYHLPWVDISTLASYGPITRKFMIELEPPKKIPPSIKELAAKLTAGATSSWARAEALHRYATRDVRYGRHPAEEWMSERREPGKMLDDLRGDCKDKSSLLVALLREAGFEAQIALVNSRQGGKTEFLPSKRFDHAIVRAQVDGREAWSDPAGGQFGFGILPAADQGAKALLLDEKGGCFIEVPEITPEQNSLSYRSAGCIGRDFSLTYHLHAKVCGERAADLREQCLDKPPEVIRRYFFGRLAGGYTGIRIEEIGWSGLDVLEESVCYWGRVVLASRTRRVEDILLLRIPWMHAISCSGPFAADERNQPLWLSSTQLTEEEYRIELPRELCGYGLPVSTVESCPWAEYSYRVELERMALVCRRSLKILGGVVPSERFGELKAFWERCARADDTEVILMGCSSFAS
ncbi:MAG: DUF3857 domain-containing protein [Planctomycetes bacterium]|nr:DUF3857 domain-containing protein [Planctomycetota bacterium]